MKTTKHVEELLRQGRKPKELVELGFPKSVVTRVHRQLKEEKTARGAKGEKGGARARSHSQLSAVSPEGRELASATAPSELDLLAVAARDHGRWKQTICAYLNRDVCSFWSWDSKEGMPQGIGAPVEDKEKWRVKPSELYCAICTVDLELRLLEVEGEVATNPLSGVRRDFKCACGSQRQIFGVVKCHACGRQTWWGWRK